MSKAFLDESEVQEITKLSRSTRDRLARAGRFPAKVALSPRRKCYRVSDIRAWVESCGGSLDSLDESFA